MQLYIKTFKIVIAMKLDMDNDKFTVIVINCCIKAFIEAGWQWLILVLEQCGEKSEKCLLLMDEAKLSPWISLILMLHCYKNIILCCQNPCRSNQISSVMSELGLQMKDPACSVQKWKYKVARYSNLIFLCREAELRRRVWTMHLSDSSGSTPRCALSLKEQTLLGKCLKLLVITCLLNSETIDCGCLLHYEMYQAKGSKQHEASLTLCFWYI